MFGIIMIDRRQDQIVVLIRMDRIVCRGLYYEFQFQIGCKNKLPQIGWNSIKISKDHHLLKGIPAATDFYFVNSFVFVAKDKSYELANTNYGIDFTSVICKENIYGTQFHPEKSSKAGRKLLMNFLNA